MDELPSPIDLFKVKNKWGLLGIAAWPLSYAAVFFCVDVLKLDKPHALVPFISLQLTAVGFGFVAALRGSTLWIFLSLLSAGMVFLALLGIVAPMTP